MRALFIGACLGLTAIASMMSSHNQDEEARVQFTMLVNDTHKILRSRLNSYVHNLRSAAAFVASNENLNSKDWRNFVELIDIEKNLPGVTALGLVRALSNSELGTFVAKRRQDGMDSYFVHPRVDTTEHLIIEFIEPIAGNEGALGLDLTFDLVRAGLLQAARDSDEEVLSPPLKLVQYPTNPGFVFARAAYSYAEGISNDAKERRRVFHGWVVAPFIGEIALANLTADEDDRFNLSVYDLSESDDELLIYDRREHDEASSAPRFTVALSEPMFGRTWSMRFTSTPSFEASVDSYESVIVFMIGLTMTGLLGTLLEVLFRRVNTVKLLVDNRTRQLKSRVEENRSIIESAFLPILILNENEEIINANPAALRLAGFNDLSDMKGRPLSYFASPTTTPDLTFASELGAWTHRWSDDRLLNVHRSSWSDADGFLRHSLLIQDVTEEADAARRITQAEQRWYHALNGADIGVFDVNLETGQSIVSATWRRLMQVSNASPNYDHQADFLSRISKDDLAQLKDADRKCIEGETDRSICEYRIIDRDGNWRWMRSDAAVAERTKDGKALRLLGAQMDVTNLHNARQALETSQKRFQRVLSEAPVGMAVLDKDGFFISVNEALCKFLGYSEDEMIGSIRLGNILGHDALKKIIAAIGAHVENRLQAYRGDHEWIACDGSKIWGLLCISWTFDPETQSDIYIAQVNDITEKKNIERMKNEFVATVSHELRTPLTSIKGSLALLLASKKNSEGSSERLLEIAQKNTDRLIAIVNDILDLEKMASGRASFDIGPHSLLDIAKEAVTVIEPYAEKCGVSVKLDLPDDPMMARLDPSRTHQVMANLLSNACKFSYPGGEVWLRAEFIDDQFIIFIYDNGRGVPDSFKQQIFKPFVQADNSDTRQFAGTGLGLHITRQIVERMGGRIDFSSEEDKLTVFWFTLPAAKSEDVVAA